MITRYSQLVCMVSIALCSQFNFSQVGIGTTAPAAGSVLDITSLNKGILIPRLGITDLNTISPVTGGATKSLLVYNTNVASGEGFYYWNGTRWVGIDGEKDWKLGGNANTTAGTDFIGTTDAQDVVFKANNSETMRLDTGGRLLVNTTTPAYTNDLIDIEGTLSGTTTGYDFPFNVYGEGAANKSSSVYASQRGRGSVFWAENFAATGGISSMFSESETTIDPAVEGRTNHPDTQSIGVLGLVNFPGSYDAKGVVGRANTTNSGWGYGVYGEGNWYGLYTPDDSGAGGVKTFLIDHPLDPENKMLKHFSVESNEVLNMYRGTIVFDNKGEAEVTLPNYFTAININYSYQLSAIGKPMPTMYIAKEIDEKGIFLISGGKKGAKVSWTVYANRNDQYLQKYPEKAIAELAKKQGQEGKYLQPKVWDKPEKLGINYHKYNLDLSKGNKR